MDKVLQYFIDSGASAEKLDWVRDIQKQAAAENAAADERMAVESANRLGLTGQEAEAYKVKLIADVNAARAAVRAHCESIICSPEGLARPKAALELATTPNLSLADAMARLRTQPIEEPAGDAAAFVLSAGR